MEVEPKLTPQEAEAIICALFEALVRESVKPQGTQEEIV